MNIMEKITKNLIPIAIVIAGLFVAGALFYVNQSSSGDIGARKVGEKTISYVNENLLDPEISASLVDVSDVGGVYKVRLEIEDVEFDSYVSKDGEFLFPEGINMKEALVQDFETSESTEASSLSLEEIEMLENFVQCLADADFAIYGNRTCPACAGLVAQFGGYDIVAPIFVECSENPELCNEKEIEFVPTIFIGNEKYAGAMSFESFTQETGCSL